MFLLAGPKRLTAQLLADATTGCSSRLRVAYYDASVRVSASRCCGENPERTGQQDAAQQQQDNKRFRTAERPFVQASKLELFWMKPHLDVVGTANRKFPLESSATAAKMSRTACLITLWEVTLSLLKNLGFGENKRWTRLYDS